MDVISGPGFARVVSDRASLTRRQRVSRYCRITASFRDPCHSGRKQVVRHGLRLHSLLGIAGAVGREGRVMSGTGKSIAREHHFLGRSVGL